MNPHTRNDLRRRYRLSGPRARSTIECWALSWTYDMSMSNLKQKMFENDGIWIFTPNYVHVFVISIFFSVLAVFEKQHLNVGASKCHSVELVGICCAMNPIVLPWNIFLGWGLIAETILAAWKTGEFPKKKTMESKTQKIVGCGMSVC